MSSSSHAPGSPHAGKVVVLLFVTLVLVGFAIAVWAVIARKNLTPVGTQDPPAESVESPAP